MGVLIAYEEGNRHVSMPLKGAEDRDSSFITPGTKV